jgi:general secretion pathway protein N
MKRNWPLVVPGIAAFIVFALATLPATVVTSRLARFGISAAGVSGSAWNGQAQVLQAGALNLGTASWKLHPLALFTARLQADVQLTRPDGFAKSAITISPSGRTRFDQLTASVPLAALPPSVLPGGWTGTLNLKLAELTVERGWPVSATGTVEAVDLTGPARKPSRIGSYKVALPAPNQATTQNELTGALTDMGGTLQIVGTLQLKPDRSYVIEGLVATRPDTPRDVADSLQFLGTPDAQGRRPFSLAGTF